MDLSDVGAWSADRLRSAKEQLRLELRGVVQDDRGELRQLTPPEEETVSRLLRQIERVETHEQIRATVSNPRHTEGSFGASLVRSYSEADPTESVGIGPAEARDRALRVLDARGADLAPDSIDHVDEMIRSVISPDSPHLDGSLIAKRILVTESDDYRSAWHQMMTQDHPLLTNTEVAALRAYRDLERLEARAAGEVTTTAGGFGVPTFIDASVILTGQGSDNPFFQISRVVNVTTNVWKGVSSAGVTWAFQTEAAVVTDNSPTLAQPAVRVHMARGFIPYSIEVEQDYPSFAAEMSRLLQAGYEDLLLNKFTQGSGSTEPFGILTALSANTNVRVSVATSGTNFNASDPYTLWKALPQRYRMRAKWLMSVDVNNAFRQLGSDTQLHAMTVQLPTQWLDKMFNKPIYESPYMPDTTTSTSATIGLAIVGDFENFVIARRVGMSIEPIKHLFQQTTAGTGVGMPTGQRGFFAAARVGSDSVNDLAFRLLVNT